MKIDECQNLNLENRFLKSFIIRTEQAMVQYLRKIKFYRLVRSVKNFLGYKYYRGQKSEIPVVDRLGKAKQAQPDSCIKVGDFIKIKSREEILKTLDENNKLDGCFFMQEMFNHCSNKLKVIKKVEYFYDEATNKMRKARTTYLLEDIHCSGALTGYWTQCDRNCYSFWKEAWLEKIE